MIAGIALAGCLSSIIASRTLALAEPSHADGWIEGGSQTDRSSFASGAGASGTGVGSETNLRLAWRRSDGFGGRGEAGFSAVAADTERGWLALGGDAGLAIGRPFHAARARSLALEGVRDLRFGTSGALYIATTHGFWVMTDLATSRASELREVSPATGAAARRINRIATGNGFVALATDLGAFVANPSPNRGDEHARRQLLHWKKLDAGFPTGSVSAIAAEVVEHATYLWAIVGPALWRVQLSAAGVALEAREIVVPGRLHGELPVDLVTDLPGDVIALVYPDSIFYRVRGAPSGRNVWENSRPVLPPGARIERLGHGAGLYWLATDRGLLVSHSRSGPWRRAGPPAGRAAAHQVAILGTRLYLASAGGLIYSETAAHDRNMGRIGTAATRSTRVTRKLAPSIGAVHRVALRHQGLETRVFDDAWRGVHRRGWYPLVALRLGVDRDEARNRDDDEIFVSGEFHRLRDQDKDQSLDLAASLTLTWDLRDLAYEPDQIDLSREARLVIGLRDDVLDEVNQLYFERLAVESELAHLRSAALSERDSSSTIALDSSDTLQRVVTLELRLAEVTAGLDAWTGGWFSEQFERSPADGL